MWTAHIKRVVIAQHCVDFRKRYDGLLGEAYKMGADPYAGDCILFFSRDSTQLRFLAGDDLGLYLGCRRFDGGRIKRNFQFTTDPSHKTISVAELLLLLEGAFFTIHKRTRKWK